MLLDVMTIPIHAPNITVKFYTDSDHYTVSGWLRICNILLSYLVESLPFPWISRSERHLVRGGTRGARKSSPTTINEGLVGFGPLPGEYTSTPLDVHARITQVGYEDGRIINHYNQPPGIRKRDKFEC